MFHIMIYIYMLCIVCSVLWVNLIDAASLRITRMLTRLWEDNRNGYGSEGGAERQESGVGDSFA